MLLQLPLALLLHALGVARVPGAACTTELVTPTLARLSVRPSTATMAPRRRLDVFKRITLSILKSVARIGRCHVEDVSRRARLSRKKVVDRCRRVSPCFPKLSTRRPLSWQPSLHHSSWRSERMLPRSREPLSRPLTESCRSAYGLPLTRLRLCCNLCRGQFADRSEPHIHVFN